MLDKDGTLIYATDTSLEDICQELYIKEQTAGQVRTDHTVYMVGKAKSSILGWNYYVFRDVKGGQAGMRLPIAIFGLLFILIIVSLILVSHLIYHPIDTLLKDVSETEAQNSYQGNELEYLAGSYHNLKKTNRH